MKSKLIIIAMILSCLTLLTGLAGAFFFDQYLSAVPYMYFGFLGLTVSVLYNLLRFATVLKQKIGFLAITFLFLTFVAGWFYTPLLKDNGVYYILALISLIWWMLIEVFASDLAFLKKYSLFIIGLVGVVLGSITGVTTCFYLTYASLSMDFIFMLYRVNQKEA